MIWAPLPLVGAVRIFTRAIGTGEPPESKLAVEHVNSTTKYLNMQVCLKHNILTKELEIYWDCNGTEFGFGGNAQRRERAADWASRFR
jgi:hypothetical protein